MSTYLTSKKAVFIPEYNAELRAAWMKRAQELFNARPDFFGKTSSLEPAPYEEVFTPASVLCKSASDPTDKQACHITNKDGVRGFLRDLLFNKREITGCVSAVYHKKTNDMPAYAKITLQDYGDRGSEIFLAIERPNGVTVSPAVNPSYIKEYIQGITLG